MGVVYVVDDPDDDLPESGRAVQGDAALAASIARHPSQTLHRDGAVRVGDGPWIDLGHATDVTWSWTPTPTPDQGGRIVGQQTRTIQIDLTPEESANLSWILFLAQLRGRR
jgi:hypothetical protein